MAEGREQMQAVVSTLSHELRSPMAIVKAALANLREEVGGTLTDTQATWVATAERQCDRLLRLIQNHPLNLCSHCHLNPLSHHYRYQFHLRNKSIHIQN